MNLRGSVGGKYGARTHFSTHLRRRILHAAQGLRMIGGDDGGDELFSQDSIRDKREKRGDNKEREKLRVLVC